MVYWVLTAVYQVLTELFLGTKDMGMIFYKNGKN